MDLMVIDRFVVLPCVPMAGLRTLGGVKWNIPKVSS